MARAIVRISPNGHASGRAARDEIVRFIEGYVTEHGYAPGVREVAAGVGISVSTAHHHLKRLRAARIVDWIDEVPRTIHLIRREA